MGLDIRLQNGIENDNEVFHIRSSYNQNGEDNHLLGSIGKGFEFIFFGDNEPKPSFIALDEKDIEVAQWRATMCLFGVSLFQGEYLDPRNMILAPTSSIESNEDLCFSEERAMFAVQEALDLLKEAKTLPNPQLIYSA